MIFERKLFSNGFGKGIGLAQTCLSRIFGDGIHQKSASPLSNYWQSCHSDLDFFL